MESISIFSSGEWTPNKVGPNEIISISGYFSLIIPHSKPAWIALTSGSLLKCSLEVFFATLRISELTLGFQPGYPSVTSDFAPARLNTEWTISTTSSISEGTELLWDVTTVIYFSSVVIVARLVEVSVNPGISGDILITPWGTPYKAERRFF